MGHSDSRYHRFLAKELVSRNDHQMLILRFQFLVPKTSRWLFTKTQKASFSRWRYHYLRLALHIICRSAHLAAGGLGLRLRQTTQRCLMRLRCTAFLARSSSLGDAAVGKLNCDRGRRLFTRLLFQTFSTCYLTFGAHRNRETTLVMTQSPIMALLICTLLSWLFHMSVLCLY